MKGIVLAGGSGTRLHPMTKVVSKHLLPVYDKPMVHYPVSTLMLAGVREILIISTPHDLPRYRELLGDGSELGLRFSYAEQPKPRGLADALIIGRSFADGDDIALILGDNIFYGGGLVSLLEDAARRNHGATVFGYRVQDARRYGVATFDEEGNVLALEEKPEHPRSNWAVTGLYFYDHRATRFAASLQPSQRGELEITDLNRCYLDDGSLQLVRLGRGFAWLDTGTPESLMAAAQFIQTIEERQGMKIACLEEIAWRKGFIGRNDLEKLAERHAGSPLGQYLAQTIRDADVS